MPTLQKVVLLAATFVLGFCLVARADATITITLSGAGAASTSQSMIVIDADGKRFLGWAQAAYPTVAVPPVETDPAKCKLSPPECRPTERATTAKEAIDLAFRGLLSGMRNNVTGHEQEKSARTARDAVAPINSK